MASEAVDITIVFPARRWFPESRITAPFTPMGHNLFRMETGFSCGIVSFGDVIEALPTDREGVLVFCRRVKRAGLRRSFYIIPHDFTEKSRFVELMNKISDLGGFAAVDFKGLFLVYLPKRCHLDVSREIENIAAMF